MSRINLVIQLSPNKVAGFFTDDTPRSTPHSIMSVSSTDVFHTQIALVLSERGALGQRNVFQFRKGKETRLFDMTYKDSNYSLNLKSFGYKDTLSVTVSEDTYLDISKGITSYRSVGPTLVKIIKGDILVI